MVTRSPHPYFRGRKARAGSSQSSRQSLSHLSILPRLLLSNALLLAAPSPQDSAQFECVVSNEVGEARRLYQVTVHGKSEPRSWGSPCP
jgi:hypothetical protein